MSFNRKEMKTEAKQTLQGNFWKVVGIGLLLITLPTYIASLSATDKNSILSMVSLILSLFTVPLLELLCQTWYRHRDESHFNQLFQQLANHLKRYWKGILMISLIVAGWIFLWMLPVVVIIVIGSMITNETSMILIMVLFVLLALILVIYKTMQYSQSFYIYRDAIDQNQSISYNQCVTKSKQLMKGHCFEYFVLQLSFIWWLLLDSVTLGLATTWVTPYMSCTRAAFYQRLIQQ